MKIFRIQLRAAILLSFCAATTIVEAQKPDSIKTSEVKIASPNSKLSLPVKFTPPLYLLPFYNPMPLNIKLSDKHLPTTANPLLLKSTSTDNAINSINLTLANDRRVAKKNEVLGAIAISAVLGGVINQAVNGKELSKEAQRRRENSIKPPTRR